MITATLKQATRIGSYVGGFIYGDTRLRFTDGTYVRTSRVVRDNGNIIHTASGNQYAVEWMEIT